MGGSLSGSKVVRRMVFGQESEGAFYLALFSPLPSTYKYWTNSYQTPHTGTIKHATAAKVAVFTSVLDIAQIEPEGPVPIKNANRFTSGKEEHLEKVRRFLTFLFF